MPCKSRWEEGEEQTVSATRCCENFPEMGCRLTMNSVMQNSLTGLQGWEVCRTAIYRLGRGNGESLV